MSIHDLWLYMVIQIEKKKTGWLRKKAIAAALFKEKNQGNRKEFLYL